MSPSLPDHIPEISDITTAFINDEAKYFKPYTNSPIAQVLLPIMILSLNTQKHRPRTRKKNVDREYDFIIVGAGSGGGTLAGRLSEMSCLKILLLEAGKLPPHLTEIPLVSRQFVGTDIDWSFYTEPQNFTGSALIDNKFNYPAGKVVGGSSIINAMLYVRGHRDIYDEWDKQGATGWSYDDVLPYFKKSEEVMEGEPIEKEYHGFDGPLKIGKPRFDSPYRSAIIERYKELGYTAIDVNGRYQKGIYDYQTTTKNGQRCSVAKAYLVPADERKNLHIKENSYVTEIIIEDGQAVGVKFTSGGKEHEVRARREIILSAGAVNTPKLLMLSGIGPKEHLEEMGIPLVADLPVGQNLRDHAASLVPYYSPSLESMTKKIKKPSTTAKYLLWRTGLLTVPGAVQYISFLTNDRNSSADAVPDYEIYFIDGVDKVMELTFNLRKDVHDQVFSPYQNVSSLWCVIENTHSKSQGYVKLRSKDPYENPIIDPRFLSDPQDRNDMVEGMKECDRVVLSEPFAKLGVKPFETIFPNCENYSENREEYFTCITHNFAFTASHQSGTAKMGSPDSDSTVVDPNLRVKGVEGLRVVDASIMPVIPAGNTNVPVIMIAEKAADIIKSSVNCEKN